MSISSGEPEFWVKRNAISEADLRRFGVGLDPTPDPIVTPKTASRRLNAILGGASEAREPVGTQVARARAQRKEDRLARQEARAEKNRIASREHARAHAAEYAARSIARYYEHRDDPAFKKKIAENSLRYAERKPLAKRAHKMIQYRIAVGAMQPASAFPCADCGKPSTDYDHRDYTKPLEVEPTCRSCNLLRGPAFPYISNLESELKV